MEAFILILFLKSGYAGGAISQEFSGEAACVSALNTVEGEASWSFRVLLGICVPKGGE